MEEQTEIELPSLQELLASDQFFERLNRKICFYIRPRIRTNSQGTRTKTRDWQSLADTDEFQKEFNAVVEKFFSTTGYAEIQHKFRESVESDFTGYVLGGVSYFLSSRRNEMRKKPFAAEFQDEFIDGRSAGGEGAESFVHKTSAEWLDQLLEPLSEEQRAVVLLRIWPGPHIPDEIRPYAMEPILQVGQKNDLHPSEVQVRLDAAVLRCEENSRKEAENLRLLEIELETEHAHASYFDSQKRYYAARLTRIQLDIPQNLLKEGLREECFISVEQENEADVLSRHKASEIYGIEGQPGEFRGRNANAARYANREFALSCYRQKRSRNRYLRAGRELARKPEVGLMPHEDITHILNLKSIGTCFSLLSRARTNLTKHGSPEDKASGVFAPTSQARSEYFERELDAERLRQHVCEDLLQTARKNISRPQAE